MGQAIGGELIDGEVASVTGRMFKNDSIVRRKLARIMGLGMPFIFWACEGGYRDNRDGLGLIILCFS